MEILPKKIRKKLIIFKKYSMKFISVIPARKNSQGIKNKNIMNIYNKPLIEYTFKEVNITIFQTLNQQIRFNIMLLM